MKKISLLYACALSLLLFQTSCNKDDEAPAPNPLIGEWELYKVNVDFPGSNRDGEYPANLFVDFYKVTFNADNSFVEEVSANFSPINTAEGEWTLTNKEVTLDFDSGTDETYTLNETNTLLTGESFNADFGDEGAPDVAAVTFILRKDQ